MKIRVETSNTEEVDNLIKLLSKEYTIEMRSKEYANRCGINKRTYIEVSKK